MTLTFSRSLASLCHFRIDLSMCLGRKAFFGMVLIWETRAKSGNVVKLQSICVPMLHLQKASLQGSIHCTWRAERWGEWLNELEFKRGSELAKPSCVTIPDAATDEKVSLFVLPQTRVWFYLPQIPNEDRHLKRRLQSFKMNGSAHRE